jgi:hypothetical protein
MRTIETTTRRRFGTGLLATAGLLAAARPARSAPPDTILNVSYDIARELFAQINPAFAAAWKARTGQDIKVDQSHGGSSRQARAVLGGLAGGRDHLQPGARQSRCCTTGQADPGRLAEAPARTTARPTTPCRRSSSARATRRASRTGAT